MRVLPAVLGILALLCFGPGLGAALAAPVVTDISPNNGTEAGGTAVTITGTGFASGATVKFGGSSAGSVSFVSSTSLVATSPAGSGLVDVRVTVSGVTSAAVAGDQFAYDSPPSPVWLGINSNSPASEENQKLMTSHDITYDRSWALEWTAGELPEAGDGLAKSIAAGFHPIVTIEHAGYVGEWGKGPIPTTPEAITAYVEGFVKTASAIVSMYPSDPVLFEPINEPWGHGTAAQYATIIAQLLPAAEKAGVPLDRIYVGGYGREWKSELQWIPAMYAAKPELQTMIKGWYLHPYGPPNEIPPSLSEGILSVPVLQEKMTSGQNNVIVSEIGFCSKQVMYQPEPIGCGYPTVSTMAESAQKLTETLRNAWPMHQQGWLKALLVYSRTAQGWEMEYAGLLSPAGKALTQFADSLVAYQGSFGTSGSENGQMNSPSDAAVDRDGNVWVTDTNNNRLQKFNSKGEYLTKFGSSGTGNGQFNRPSGVAIDPSGNIWVADATNHRVQKFNSNGEFLLKFGSEGTGNGQFSYWGPKGLAVDSSGNVWVTDYSGRFQKFNPAGEFVKAVGSFGTGNGQFDQSAGIDVGPDGRIWVSDYNNNRVQVFNSNGEYLFKFGSVGSGNGQFTAMDGLEVDPYGDVWVADGGNSRIQKFNSNGEFLYKFGSYGSGENQFRLQWPYGLTSDARGNLWIADSINNRIQHWQLLTHGPTYSASYGSIGSGTGQLSLPADAAVDSSGNVWVADLGNNRLEKFSSSGEYLSTLGSLGSGNGQLHGPSGVAIDASGNIWVADTLNYRIEKFNSKGEFLLKFGSEGSGNGQFSHWGPKGVAIDSSGNVWVTDYSERIQKFSPSGEFLKAVGSFGTGNGQFNQSAGIDVGPGGKIWVGDFVNNRVQVFNSSGEYQFQFGSVGSGNGQFSNLDGVEVDSNGHVWVEDETERIQEFTQKGEFVRKFGSTGSGEGQFQLQWPFALTSNDKGTLWIPDVNNNRLQKWAYRP